MTALYNLNVPKTAQQAITGTTHNCILRRQIIQNDSEIRPNVLLIINVLCKSFIA